MRTILVLFALLCVQPAMAELRIFTCEPEWAALAAELAPQAQIESATTGLQDPHFIQARPSLIARVRRADLLICTGADLELGWLPLLLRQSANPRVQVGQPGHFEAAMQVQRLEIPERIDRSEGDIHPFGNPHVQLDPHNITVIAAALAERLAQIDPDGAAGYRARHADFESRWQAAIAAWEQRARPLAGIPTVSHHRSWIYLNRWLGLNELANLEPKPGLPPSTAHLARLLGQLEGGAARVIIRSAYQDTRGSDWLSGRTDIPVVVLPHTVGSVDGSDDLFAMFDTLIDVLLSHAPEAA